MLSFCLSTLRLSHNRIDFISGCSQSIICNSFFYNKLKSLNINLDENSLRIFIIKFYVLVVSIEIYCENFTSVYFTYQTKENSIRIFYCDFKIFCLLSIINNSKSTVVSEIKYIDNKFKLFLFGGIPLEHCLFSTF